ncbi:MAG: endonuclease MutS2 [Clostridia bacterium]|nr:endonuclease MutS2 [Clostridia bacterium]
MVSEKVLKMLEYGKVLDRAAEYAVLESSKTKLKNSLPANDFLSAEIALKTTAEADKLLYTYSVSGVDFFDEITDELDRAEKGATLSCAEILRVMRLMQSSRVTRRSVTAVDDDGIVYIRRAAESLFTDRYLENDIREKIISDDKIADNASETLYQIRRKIKRLNEQIREKLASFVRGNKLKYLQENIVTMRGDRYVLPVKSEYRGQIKGLIHDQSSTGATLFIEPEAVVEMNNDLRTATIEESAEMEKILSDLSHSVGAISQHLRENIEFLSDVDVAFAKAEFAYKTKAFCPILREDGVIEIKKGRHPLIDAEKVVPLDISLGKEYNYLLITGPNTGGKTVCLKLAGLFTIMAASGFFVPAAEGSRLSFFESVFADVGDEQSIEQSLSTFSSHMKNIIEIVGSVNEKSLVLLDEIGAGTDPDEGGALAQAIIEKLVRSGSYGIITTHYSRLKEYAYVNPAVMNASMDFDGKTFAPLYKLVIGMPGSSNAIEISKRLGLGGEIADSAYGLLTENKISFENVLREAEKTRQEAESIRSEYYLLKREAAEELDSLRNDRAKFDAERQRFSQGVRAETRKIVNEKAEEAEEIIEEIKEIMKKSELDGGDIIRARTLKNKLENIKYGDDDLEDVPAPTKKADISSLKAGDRVYVRSIDGAGVVQRVSLKKKEVEVAVGSLRMNVKAEDLYEIKESKPKNKAKASVSFSRDVSAAKALTTEINVIGQTVEEALLSVDRFLDGCVIGNVEECRIVHGKGLFILGRAIQDHLKKDPRVKEYRYGAYGEGEKGVTIVRLK